MVELPRPAELREAAAGPWCWAAHPATHHPETLVHGLADLHALLFGGSFDALLNRSHIVWIILGSILLAVNVTPGRPDVLRRIDRLLIVHGIGKFDVAVFAFTFLRVDVVPPVNPITHRRSSLVVHACCIINEQQRCVRHLLEDMVAADPVP